MTPSGNDRAPVVEVVLRKVRGTICAPLFWQVLHCCWIGVF